MYSYHVLTNSILSIFVIIFSGSGKAFALTLKEINEALGLLGGIHPEVAYLKSN